MLIARTESRMTAVIGLGVVGYGMALVFMLHGGPDLAMTQFAVETLSVVLFVLVVYRLPKFTELSRRTTRVRDAAAAGREQAHIDYLAFTGHKGLMGPTGTGGLCVADDAAITSSYWGGTGVRSADPFQPEEFPYRLEARFPGGATQRYRDPYSFLPGWLQPR